MFQKRFVHWVTEKQITIKKRADLIKKIIHKNIKRQTFIIFKNNMQQERKKERKQEKKKILEFIKKRFDKQNLDVPISIILWIHDDILFN